MIAVLLATVLAAALTLPSLAAAPDALSRLVGRGEPPAYRGEQIIATWNGGQAQTTLVQVEHDPPQWTRLAYRPVGTRSTRVVLRQGDADLEYDPASLTGTTRTRLPDLDDELIPAHLAWLRESYRITTAPSEVLGRPVERIDLAPTVPDRPSRRMYIDAQTGVVLRSERVTPDGRLGEVTAFVSFEVMPRGWRASASAPPGLRVSTQPAYRAIVEQDATRLLGKGLPRFVPPQGFHLVGTYMTADRPATVQRVYTDGLSVLVLTQRPGSAARAPEGSRMIQTEDGPVWLHAMGLRTFAHWSSSGWILSLVGDVTPESMLAVARRTGISPPPRLMDRLISWISELRRRIVPSS